MMANPHTDLAQRFFDALRRKDLGALPLAAHIVLESPVCPRLRGVESVREFLEAVAAVTKAVRVLGSIAEGNKAAVEFELETAEGAIAGFVCFEFSDGRIEYLRPYFDSRPLLGNNV